MKEYEIYFIGNNGALMFGWFYGRNDAEAKNNAVGMGISRNKIRSCEYKEEYRGYGHI